MRFADARADPCQLAQDLTGLELVVAQLAADVFDRLAGLLRVVGDRGAGKGVVARATTAAEAAGFARVAWHRELDQVATRLPPLGRVDGADQPVVHRLFD